jgi:hypothetical protein
MKNLLCLLLCGIFLNGCATLSKEDCLRGDWFAIGKADGKEGRRPDYVDLHAKACTEHKVRPDLVAYQRGRAEGLNLYCIPHNGFELGRKVETYEGICPANLQEEFLKAYVAGVEQAQRSLEEDINNQQRALRAKQSDLSYAKEDKKKGLEKEVSSLRSNLESLQNKRHQTDNLLAEYSRYRGPSENQKMFRDTLETAADVFMEKGVKGTLDSAGKLIEIIKGGSEKK